MQTRLKHTQPIFFPSEKERGPFCLFSVFFAFKMLPLISPQCCLSSQLPPCQPALLLPLPCSSRYSSQAKPQLSHMPCLLDVWTKLGGSEAKTAFLKWVGPSQAGRLEMSSPLIPWGTETENKWSLTPLFSQGPGCDLPLLRNKGWSADARCLVAELSSGLSGRHNGKGPWTLPASSSTFNPSCRLQHSLFSGTADNSVGLFTRRWPGE